MEQQVSEQIDGLIIHSLVPKYPHKQAIVSFGKFSTGVESMTGFKRCRKGQEIEMVVKNNKNMRVLETVKVRSNVNLFCCDNDKLRRIFEKVLYDSFCRHKDMYVKTMRSFMFEHQYLNYSNVYVYKIDARLSRN